MRLKELLFTGLYTGYSPVGPGTVGTILALVIYVLEFDLFGSSVKIVNLIVVVILLYPAIRLGDAAEKFFNKKDPGEAVLDEIMGYWISVLFFPFDWKIVLLAFIIFRILDIAKPFPIRYFERYKGGLGIMMDDYVGGTFTNIILRLIILLTGSLGLNIF